MALESLVRAWRRHRMAWRVNGSAVVARFGERRVVDSALRTPIDGPRAAIRVGAPRRSAGSRGKLPLVRDPDPRKDAGVATLVKLDDPTASRAIAVMLKAGSAESRGLVIDALGASRARRANLLLTAALQEIVPLGRDHGLTLRLLTALRFVGDDQSVQAIAKVIRVWSWLYWVQDGHVKRAGVGLLASMPSRAAAAALDEAARTGDLRLRSYARGVETVDRDDTRRRRPGGAWRLPFARGPYAATHPIVNRTVDSVGRVRRSVPSGAVAVDGLSRNDVIVGHA